MIRNLSRYTSYGNIRNHGHPSTYHNHIGLQPAPLLNGKR